MPSEHYSQRELYLPAGRAGSRDLAGRRVSRSRAVENREVGYVGDGEVRMIERVKNFRSELDTLRAIRIQEERLGALRIQSDHTRTFDDVSSKRAACADRW